MNTKLCAALASSLMLIACGQPVGGITEAPIATAPVAAEAEPQTLTPAAERGVEGARNVLLTFARLIERQDFNGAWEMLSPTDRQKWNDPAFAALFDGLGKITVAAPTGTIEGATGSSYYTAPITITGDAPGAAPITGEAVLRRVNDVDGATPAQLRWHFETLSLGKVGG